MKLKTKVIKLSFVLSIFNTVPVTSEPWVAFANGPVETLNAVATIMARAAHAVRTNLTPEG